MRHRPNYSVVATVVVLMIFLAFAANEIKPLIPGPPPNPIASYPGGYLEQASAQRIDWHPIDANAFAEARRLDRPVLILIGVAWSQHGRQFDNEVLSSAEVQNYLSHNFMCVRIDSDEMPAWRSAYLPVSRSSLGIRPRFQMWVLEPDGRLVANMSRRQAKSRYDAAQFLDELVGLRRTYTQMRQQNLTSDVDAQQLQDIALIEEPSHSPMPDFAAIKRAIVGSTSARYGGFPQNGYQDLYPFGWEYLAQTNELSALMESLRPALESPIADLLDGGFFVTSRSTDWKTIEFDKSAVVNAEMAWMLSQVRPQMAKPSSQLCEYLMEKTVGSLTGEFVDDRGFIRAARLGDESADGRSARTSIPPKRMREALTPEQRETARSVLGLRVETNPTMTPFLASSENLRAADGLLVALKGNLKPSSFADGEYMDVNGTVAARVMEIGRALHDSRMIDFGDTLFSRLDALRVGDEVPHDLEVTARAPATLGDYLAFSDAALQDYLSSGRVVSLQHGLAVLQRALTIFAGPSPGEFRVGLPPSSDLIPSESVTAEVIDDVGESTTAKVVRLCTAYGRLMLGDNSDSNPGLMLIRTAFATARLIADPAGTLGIASAGFASASLTLADDEYAFAVGPNAQNLADELYAMRPLRFVAPVFGPVRPDLRDKPPGLYVLREGVPFGPLTVDKAAAQLPPTLSAALK